MFSKFGKNTKTVRQGKPRKSIKFNSFRENKAFFACGHIDFCVEKTKALRKDESQLLLSFILPHGIISTQTISHLILQLLSLAVINTRTFSGKSTSPKWCSHKRNFKKGFYYKDILEGSIRSGDDFMRWNLELCPECKVSFIKIKFFIKDFLKKSLMENFIFCAVCSVR